MATARAQAMAGLGVHARHVRQGAGSREGGGDAEDEPPPPPERVYTAEDDEFPLEWLKRVVKRALWTPYNYWFMAGLLVVLDMVLTMIVVLAVPCESLARGCPSPRRHSCSHVSLFPRANRHGD